MFICLISQAKTSRILGASVYAVGVDNYDINEVNVFLVSLSQNFPVNTLSIQQPTFYPFAIQQFVNKLCEC